MDSKLLYVATLLTFLVSFMAPRASADPTILAILYAPITVVCATAPPRQWTICYDNDQSQCAQSISVPLTGTGNSVECNFTGVVDGISVQKMFDAAQVPTELGVECLPNSCVWTVAEGGFYVTNTATTDPVFFGPWSQS